jgi:uncharacterized protein YukE
MGMLRVNADTQDPVDKDSSELATARPEFDILGQSGSVLSSWNGDAAQAFKNNFLAPFPAYTQNDFLLLAMLKSSLEAHQALFKSARRAAPGRAAAPPRPRPPPRSPPPSRLPRTRSSSTRVRRPSGS